MTIAKTNSFYKLNYKISNKIQLQAIFKNKYNIVCMFYNTAYKTL